MKISIAGKILRDKDDARRRNFETFVVSVFVETKFKTEETHLHVTNYAVKATSSMHRLITKEYKTSAEALAAHANKAKDKLARNRVETKSFAQTVNSVKELTDFMTDTGLRLTVANIKTFENHLNSFELETTAKHAAIAAEAETETEEDFFASKIARELSDEDLSALEERVGFGRTTKANNPNWGMF